MLKDDFQPRYRHIIPFKAAFKTEEDYLEYCVFKGLGMFDNYQHHYDGPIRLVSEDWKYENTFLSRVIFNYSKGYLNNIEIEDESPTRTSYPIKDHPLGLVPMHIQTIGQAWYSPKIQFTGDSLSCDRDGNEYSSKGFGTYYSGERFEEVDPIEPLLEFPILMG